VAIDQNFVLKWGASKLYTSNGGPHAATGLRLLQAPRQALRTSLAYKFETLTESSNYTLATENSSPLSINSACRTVRT
jgi:hypothetical protein